MTKDDAIKRLQKKYGYIDNKSGEYIADKNDLNDNFTFGGMRF